MAGRRNLATIAATVCLWTTSCDLVESGNGPSKDQSTAAKDTNGSELGAQPDENGTTPANPGAPAESGDLLPLAAKIKSHRYDATTDELHLSIEHGACNRDFKPTLAISGICAESYPIICSAKVVSEPPDYACDYETQPITDIVTSVASIKERPAKLQISANDGPLLTVDLP